MNIVERMAYGWLLKKFSEKDVVFQRRKTPNFICSDGRGYQVKRLYGRTVWFTEEQFEALKGLRNVDVLVFSDGEEPFAVIPAHKLRENAVVEGVKIVVSEGSARLSVRLRVRRDLLALVKAKATREGRNIQQVVEDILEEYFKRRGEEDGR